MTVMRGQGSLAGWKGYLQGMHLHCCALKGSIMVAYIIEGLSQCVPCKSHMNAQLDWALTSCQNGSEHTLE